MGKRIFIIKESNVRQVIAALVVVLAVTACFAAPSSYATGEEGGEQENKQAEDITTPAPQSNSPSYSDLQQDLSDVKEGLDVARGEYDDAVKELKALDSQIAALEAQIRETEGQIEDLQTQINEYSNQLFDLSERIVELDREIFDENGAINKRLRIMYMTDDQSMLAVVLGSENFVDFMSNLEMVRRIHESDVEFLAELERKLDEVERKRVEVVEIEAKLKEQQAALQEIKDQLDADKVALAAAQRRVKEIRDAAAAEVERLEKESKRIEQELVNMTSQWGDYGGGAMAWPVIGPVTSEYGMRYHPITGRYTMHTGIDIGSKSGTPIHAAADGLVYFAGWNGGGYGNLVMIDNGSGIVTMYAHCSGFAVSKGSIVHRGDIIAYVGSTGSSTGPHLHFEVRVNGAHQNPRGWF